MTQAAPIPRVADHPPRPPLATDNPLSTALALAARGLPVLPLRHGGAGKAPVANCLRCARGACGGRPNMLSAGPCRCPRPCHAWAAATTDRAALTSRDWARAWRTAVAVAYHPGGAGLTVVDLDDSAAIAWAQESLPPTLTVATTRGEHWIYQGTMRSSNAVRSGVDIKSLMAYARWRGHGTGAQVPLPDAVRALAAKTPPPARPAPSVAPGLARAGGGQCPHRAPAYLERGITMAVEQITAARSAVHATVYRAFLAVLSTHGRCGCLTEAHVTLLFTAAQAKGESPRHCTDAWTNARTRLGL
ncbi:bifunctional DNA primase/polymerase [Streptomyces buecherae]|uniref:bifunctional DNA primase/polymerase n=1 Tax=Streptomyces buecherae TaxID=2763006 RepID=UPI0036C933C2